MLLDIQHQTVYRYHAPANYSIQYARLMPRTDGGQRIIDWRISSPGRVRRQPDPFGNQVQVITVTEPHSEIVVRARGQVETPDGTGLFLRHDSGLPQLVFAQSTPLTQADSALCELAGVDEAQAGEAHPSTFSTGSSLETLMHAVSARVKYEKGSTDVSATAAQALALGRGVCQDQTHVFIACCRARGIPARYVSGYLLTRADDEASLAATHAWAEVWIADADRGAGAWLGFDVTHNRLVGPDLCRLAVGRDYMDASPIRGMRFGGSGEEMDVSVSVIEAARIPVSSMDQ